MHKKKTIGIIGGMGPMATSYLFELIIKMTDAKKDQDNIDLIIMNRASIPDRTAFLKGESSESPLPHIINEIKKLEKCDVDAFAIACNTSHYFAKEIVKSTNLKFINMIEETVKKASSRKVKKIGLMVTTGTLQTKLYQNMLESYDIDYEVPSNEYQDIIMKIIYDDVKANKPVEWDLFFEVEKMFINKGCDSFILGCTELSTLKQTGSLNDLMYIDSSEALAESIINYAKNN